MNTPERPAQDTAEGLAQDRAERAEAEPPEVHERALHPPPAGPKGPLGRLLLALPLVAIAAALAWFWRDAPQGRQLHLRFGNAGQDLLGVELACQDAQGLESGARWAFTQGAPNEVTHTTTTGAQLECRITLQSRTDVHEVTRKLHFESDEATLLLEGELRR